MGIDENAPDKKLAAVCGLYCPACSVYIGTTEEPERLKMLAERFGMPVSELECLGCRSDKRSFFCRSRCKMAACAAEKGISFCGECSEYPCEELKVFQSQAPHRIELWESLGIAKEQGLDAWFAHMRERYACPGCGTVNSAYDAASPQMRHGTQLRLRSREQGSDRTKHRPHETLKPLCYSLFPDAAALFMASSSARNSMNWRLISPM